MFWSPAADGHFRFLLAEFKVGADAVVLLLADQRTHLGFAFERRAELDALSFFGHSFEELGVDFLFDENAAARGTDFALIDKDAEEGAIDGGFPIRAIEENVGRLAAEFERDALESVRCALDDHFSDCGAAREGDFVHASMRNERGSRRFAKAVHDVDDAGRQAQFFKPTGDFHHGERRLLRGLKDTGAACSDGRSELPRSHDQRIIPGNNLSSDADGFAQSKTQGVCGNGIDVPENFVREAGVIFETSCGIGDVVLGFDDGLAGIPAFELGKLGSVGANFLRKLVEDAAAVGGSGLSPGAGVESGARGFDGAIDIGGRARRDVRDHLFGGRIVDRKHFTGRTFNPLAIDVVLIGSNDCFRSARHNCLPNSVHNTGAGAAANFRAALRRP